MFFNELCAQSHVVYQVPAGKLLVIEDASAEAFDSATANIPGNPGIVDNVFTVLSLRTNPTGSVASGSADHVIAAGRGLPLAGGRDPAGLRRTGDRDRSTPACGSPAA